MSELVTVPRSWLTDQLKHRLMQSGFAEGESSNMARAIVQEGYHLGRGEEPPKPGEEPRPATPGVDGPAVEGPAPDPHAAKPNIQSQGGPGEDPVPVRQGEARGFEEKSVAETKEHTEAIDAAIGDTVEQPEKPADQKPKPEPLDDDKKEPRSKSKRK